MNTALLIVTLLGVVSACFAIALVWHFPHRFSAWLCCSIACLLLWRVVISWLYAVCGATTVTDWSGGIVIPGAAGVILILMAFSLTTDFVELQRLREERDALVAQRRAES